MPQLMTEALARSIYKQVQPGVDGVHPTALTYGQTFFSQADPFSDRANWLIEYGLNQNAQVLIIGSAFGYLMKHLIQAGISDVWGIEGGSWFWDAANDDEWAIGAKDRTVRDWIGSDTEQESSKALGAPSKFGWVLDEDAAPMHSDSELPGFLAGCEARLQNIGKIIHLITPVLPQGPGDSAINWKPMADWKKLAPDHIWIDLHTASFI